MRNILAAATVLACAPLAAEASEVSLFGEVTVSSILIDRGEQLGRETLELTLGAEYDLGGATVYGAFYRILPFAGAQDAFDDEADYILGIAWDGQGYSADLSANRLTYPGMGEAASLELAAEIALDLPLTPTFAAFYDADLEDWGLEVTAGPEWDVADWTVYAIGRAGFVRPGDGERTRSYGGVEAGASQAISDTAVLGFYVRAEAADEDAFARHIEGGAITAVRSAGFGAGVSLSLSR